MKFSDLLGMCVRNLTRRKFRTFLTVMGVVIGTCAIIVMISLGVGISVAQEEYINSIGDLTVINVNSYGNAADVYLNDEAIAIFNAIDGVDIATPLMYFQPQTEVVMFAGKKERYVHQWVPYYLTGIYPEALEKLGYTVDTGATIGSYNGKKFDILFGSQFAYDFRDSKRRNNAYVDAWPDENGNIADPFFDPMETPMFMSVSPSETGAKELRFEGQVVGIIEGGSYYDNTVWSAYVDINFLKEVKSQYEKENKIKKDKDTVEQYEEAKVKVLELGKVAEVQATIEGMGFSCWSLDSMRESMEQSAQQIQLILGILGGVSLFVAAISITNTMIMSVYERTREIGVMKVLGCLVSNIRTIFLVEAGLIGFFGGVIGICTSYFLSFLLNTFGGMLGDIIGFGMGDGAISIIPPWLAVTGLIFATLIGIFSGFQPANRAVKISALEAIKTE